MPIRILKSHRFAFITLLLASLVLVIAARRGLLPVVQADSGGGVTLRALTLQFEGSGQVHLDPFDESFSSDSTHMYADDAEVDLVATASSGWYFDHWEGNVTGTGASRTLVMSTNKIALAVFKQPTLTVLKSGSGQVQFYVEGAAPGETLTPSFSRTYPYGAQVVLVAIPSAGWGFKEWQVNAGGKDWQVVVGEAIEYRAIASDDCENWVWDMTEGVPDMWNPTGGNAKTGTGMVIPYSDLPGSRVGTNLELHLVELPSPAPMAMETTTASRRMI